MIMEWISVEDRLPDNYQAVLIWTTAPWLGLLKAGRWHYIEGDEIGALDDRRVTHWMPLPEGPNE